MPARESEIAAAEPESTVDIAPPQAAESEAASFSTEGDLPAVVTSAAATGATASEIAFDGKPTQASGDTSHLDRGMHSYDAYREACHKAGKPEKWKDYYVNGHTSASQWDQPYERRAVNDWTLKKGTSASQALRDWMKGPTITDYRAAMLADEIDEVRDEFGDPKFDRLFGSANEAEDKAIPLHQRLRISSDAYTTPLTDQMKAIAAEADSRERGPAQAAPPPAVIEARVEEKPKDAAIQDQDPSVVAQELGIEQRDRELV